MSTLINASDLDPKALSALRSNPRFKEIFIHEYREEEGKEGVMVPITYFWPKKRPLTRRCLSGGPYEEYQDMDEDLCLDPKLLVMRRDQEEEDKRIQQLEAEYEEEENNSD